MGQYVTRCLHYRYNDNPHGVFGLQRAYQAIIVDPVCLYVCLSIVGQYVTRCLHYRYNDNPHGVFGLQRVYQAIIVDPVCLYVCLSIVGQYVTRCLHYRYNDNPHGVFGLQRAYQAIKVDPVCLSVCLSIVGQFVTRCLHYRYNDNPHGVFGLRRAYQSIIVDPADLKRYLQLNFTRYAGTFGSVILTFNVKYDVVTMLEELVSTYWHILCQALTYTNLSQLRVVCCKKSLSRFEKICKILQKLNNRWNTH